MVRFNAHVLIAMFFGDKDFGSGQKGTLHLCLIPTVSDLVNQDSQERNREDSDETWRVAVSEYCLTSVIGTPSAYLQTVVVL